MEYWHKQADDKPFFEDLVWSRPESKARAGKLLIIGGNSHGFAAPATAYAEAIQAGVGSTQIILPGALKNLKGPSLQTVLENIQFVTSTNIGSFARSALAEMLDNAEVSDGVVLAGDFGKNSETTVLMDSFASKYTGPLVITHDISNQLLLTPSHLLSRQNTTLVLTMAQLQKLGATSRFEKPFNFSMGLVHVVETLHEFSLRWRPNFIIKHNDHILVASNGKISTTPVENTEIWRVKTAAHSAVWLIQNPTKPFEALTCSVLAM